MDIEQFLEKECLPETYRHAVDRVHAQLAARLAAQRQSQRDCLTVGICGAQGSGKSTMSSVLAALLEEQGLTTAILSLDDLYLTRAERVALSEHRHPLLLTRGVPGTHDVELGIRTLDALCGFGDVALPRFDKALDDRAREEAWPKVHAPVDVVLFEGWCVGAQPEDAPALAVPLNALERELDSDGAWRRFVNDALRSDYQRLFSRLNLLVLLKAPSFDVVYRWRLEQEEKLRARIASTNVQGTKTMSDEKIARFIAHYERLTRHILREMPDRADVVVTLDEDRNVVGIDERN